MIPTKLPSNEINLFNAFGKRHPQSLFVEYQCEFIRLGYQFPLYLIYATNKLLAASSLVLGRAGKIDTFVSEKLNEYDFSLSIPGQNISMKFKDFNDLYQHINELFASLENANQHSYTAPLQQ